MALPNQGTNYIEVRARLDQLERDLKQSREMAKREGAAAGAAMEKSMGDKMQGIGRGMTKTLTPAAVAFGAFALKAFNEVDGGLDAIRAGTGATGKKLEELGESMKRVGGSVTQSLTEVGTVMADVQTRTGLMGQDLEDLTKSILDLNGRLGNQASVENVTRVYGDWSVATEHQVETLDLLYRASQATGPSIDAISQKLVQFGAPLRQMGFDLETSAALLGKFEKEGVNTNLVMGSMRIALGKLAREGVQDIPAEFQRLVESIENAGSAGEANGKALEVFGARAGPDMAAAIREGRFDLGSLFRAVKNGSETVEKAAEDTLDWSDKLKMLFNRAQTVIGPVGELGFAISGVAAVSGPAVTGLGKLANAYKGVAITAALANTSVLALAWSSIVAGASTAAVALAPFVAALAAVAAATVPVKMAFDAWEEAQRQHDKSLDESSRLLRAYAINVEGGLHSVEDFKNQIEALATAEGISAQETADLRNEGQLYLSMLENGTSIAKRYGDDVKDVGDKSEAAGKKIKKFAGMTAAELGDWRVSAEGALADISGAFGKLSDDATITADELVGAYRKQIAATRDFRQNIKVLIERGAKPEFIKSLIDMGAEGALWAEGLASSNKKTTEAFFKTRRKAGEELRGLSGLVREAATDVDRESGKMRNDFKGIGDSVGNVTESVQGFANTIADLAKIPGMTFKLGADLPEGDGPGAPGGGQAVAWATQAIAAVPGAQSISSTYRTPAHNAAVGGSPTSYHLDRNNPAADIVGENLDAVAAYLTRFPVRELLWNVEGHYDHVHVADLGARVRGPATVRIGAIDEDVLFVPRTGPGARSPGLPTGPVRLSGRLEITNWKTGAARFRGEIEHMLDQEDNFTRNRMALTD